MHKTKHLLLSTLFCLVFLQSNFAGIISEEKTVYTADSTLLAGVLDIPQSDEAVPLIIIIAGSGATDRDGNTKPMIVSNAYQKLGKALNDKGYATFRFDKRTAGQSKLPANFDIAGFTFDHFVADVGLWIDQLRQDKRLSNIILAGHSQGSLIAILAAQNKKVDAVISIAGAGQSIDKVLIDQLKVQLPETLMQECTQHFTKLKAGEELGDVSPSLMMTGLFAPQNRQFIASWMQYDPLAELKKITIPVLVVNGTTDIQVPSSEAELLATASAKNELLIIEKMNHCLVDAPADRMENIKTYNQPELKLSDGLIVGVLKFIKNTLDK